MCVSAVRVTALAVMTLLHLQACASQALAYGPARVETRPLLLDSFVPAAMQIMAHVTEQMKYDLKPTTPPPHGSTTTTVRPTLAHKPGLYAPEKPPGPQAYFAQGGLSYRDYVERLQHPSGFGYFDRYRYPLTDGAGDERLGESQPRNIPGVVDQFRNVEIYFGKNFADVARLAVRIEPDEVPNDVDAQVQDFSREYDDSNFRFELYRQKKVPPTKAYVSLLSLYDLLNKESKRLGLNKYHGYSDAVLQVLIESSRGTSAYQLKTVFNKVLERSDTKKPDIVKKIKQLVTDLDEPSSYINTALRYIPPLPFVA